MMCEISYPFPVCDCIFGAESGSRSAISRTQVDFKHTNITELDQVDMSKVYCFNLDIERSSIYVPCVNDRDL